MFLASNHVASGPVTSHPVGSGILVVSWVVWLGIPIRSCHVSSGLGRSSPVWSRQAGVCIVLCRVGILSCRVMTYSIRSGRVRSCRVTYLFCIVGMGEGILSGRILARPVRSRHGKSRLGRSRLVKWVFVSFWGGWESYRVRSGLVLASLVEFDPVSSRLVFGCIVSSLVGILSGRVASGRVRSRLVGSGQVLYRFGNLILSSLNMSRRVRSCRGLSGRVL